MDPLFPKVPSPPLKTAQSLRAFGHPACARDLSQRPSTGRRESPLRRHKYGECHLRNQIPLLTHVFITKTCVFSATARNDQINPVSSQQQGRRIAERRDYRT